MPMRAVLSSVLLRVAVGVVEPDLVLDGDVPWIVPPEMFRPSESQSDSLQDTAVALAMRDVELDWYKVLGYRAIIIANTSWNPAVQLRPKQPAVFFGDVARHPWLETVFNLTERGCDLSKGVEAHCLLRIDSGFHWGQTWVPSAAVLAVGNGTRGAIYAAYALSEQLLGVSPWYRFTEAQPAWRGRSKPVPKTPLIWAPPAFRNRAIFLNDEELLGFFRADPLGEQIFDMATLNAILETLLRAKGNTIIMGTTPYPDERSLALAARRGIILSASHFEILGFNAFAWSKALGHNSRGLWDWRKHPDLMMHTWRQTVEAQKSYEMLWSIGLRGLNDYAYPCGSQEDCGALISEAIANQTQILAEAMPGTKPQFKFNLWVEALNLYQKGLLKLPEGTSLVMSDSGAGYIRGDDSTFAHADGVYYHVQMLDGHGGQLTEFNPPSRIFEELSRFMALARATDIFVLNLSDLKPCVLTAAAALSFVWDPTPYLVNGALGAPNRTAAEAQEVFLETWTTQQFPGLESSTQTAIVDLWTDYFDLPWIVHGGSDEHIAGELGSLADQFKNDLLSNFSVSSKTLQSAQNAIKEFAGAAGAAQAAALHANATALLKSVPPARQQFYQAHLLLQSAMQRFSVEATLLMANATLIFAAITPQTKAAGIADALAAVDACLAALDNLFAAQRDAEGSSEWRGLYWGDRHRFTNFQARRREVMHVQAALLQLGAGTDGADVQIDCCQMEYAYQWTPKHLESYPLFYYDAKVCAIDFVLMSCANVTSDGGRCSNAANGGKFWSSALVELSVLRPGSQIFYTTDGADPADPATASRKLYTDSVVLSATTTLRSVAVSAEGLVSPQQRNATFVRMPSPAPLTRVEV